MLELPPRARRILQDRRTRAIVGGTTSACAENTAGRSSNPNQTWNYLRVRGEYCFGKKRGLAHAELPPRARRILNRGFSSMPRRGTTSACAENTGFPRCGGVPIRNYLRVRGEYSSSRPTSFATVELPPRARRILIALVGGVATTGTTSACAENTQRVVRGRTGFQELPPRARRIPGRVVGVFTQVGTTSACAENTSRTIASPGSIRNYLRVRGEYVGGSNTFTMWWELPPRARRIPTQPCAAWVM